MFASKENAAKLSIAAVSLLILIKVIASIITGSISIQADAIHSAIDLSSVIIGYIGIRVASKPPDAEHAFGHGKAENIAGVVISSLIFIAAGTIAYQAITRLISGSTIELVGVGIYATAAAILINAATSWYTLKVARSTDSVALEATAREILTDVFSSGAVLIGLILVWLTGISLLDPIVALLVAALIVRTAYVSMKRSFGGLIDTRLPEEEETEIRACIMEYSRQLVGFHALRTRKAGSQRYIELHLVVPKNASVEVAHRLCDQLERDIETRLKHTSVTIHTEPCTIECEQCSVSCSLRKKGG